MSIWGVKSNSGIKPAQPKIRIERVADEKKKPAPLPSKLASHRRPALKSQGSAQPSPASLKSRPSPATPDRLEPDKHKRKALRQKSPSARPDFSSDSDDENDIGSPASFEEVSNKRQKVDPVGRIIDTKRKLRSQQAFSQADDGIFPIIHAADISSPARKSKISDVHTDTVTVELKYPSASQREKYDLVFGKDKIDPIQEIYDIAEIVKDVYLTEAQQKPFTDPNSGIIRKIERAKNLLSRDRLSQDLLDGFKDAVDIYNKELERLIKDGILAKNLDNRHHLPFDMVRLILRQVYDRAVSPEVDLLKAYENGTDNVYGELLPDFVSRILEQTKLKSDQVFVDLGSGVGNVVLQAALEVGCESWGCEMMENACTLAERQRKEFKARCRLWGVQPGDVHLERGDFLENDLVKEAMTRADVILVNNQAFTPELNQKLIDLFLDVKDGCQIVSLRSFVPQAHQITPRNIDNPVNLLRVVEDRYYANSVSWTDAGGKFFRATKDQNRLQKYIDKFSREG